MPYQNYKPYQPLRFKSLYGNPNDPEDQLTPIPNVESYFGHVNAYVDGITPQERSEQFGGTHSSLIPAVQLIDQQLTGKEPFAPPGTRLDFTMNAPVDAGSVEAQAINQLASPAGSTPQGAMPDWIRQLGADVVADYHDFMSYLETASPQEKQQIAIDFGIAAATFAPVVGDAVGLGVDVAGLRHEALCHLTANRELEYYYPETMLMAAQNGNTTRERAIVSVLNGSQSQKFRTAAGNATVPRGSALRTGLQNHMTKKKDVPKEIQRIVRGTLYKWRNEIKGI